MVAALNDAGAASNVARYHILSEAYTFNELIGSTETILFSPGVEVLFAGSGVIHDPRPLTTDASVSDDSAVTADNGNLFRTDRLLVPGEDFATSDSVCQDILFNSYQAVQCTFTNGQALVPTSNLNISSNLVTIQAQGQAGQDGNHPNVGGAGGRAQTTWVASDLGTLYIYPGQAEQSSRIAAGRGRRRRNGRRKWLVRRKNRWYGCRARWWGKLCTGRGIQCGRSLICTKMD
mmetsp:Transcript_9646/g.26691  ORF Transcript_9646/g.26691 Transcript_9646/m.26691 type:complete len:233 (+) Transcript_9646:379-1077(+)